MELEFAVPLGGPGGDSYFDGGIGLRNGCFTAGQD
jgi:hypothetical protein